MAQIFSRKSNVYARVVMLALVVLPISALAIASAITRSPYNTNVGIPITQPVPFSHEHHVVELGIDCRYCHTYVEKSGNPGLPSTQVCMSCHSQIWTDSPLIAPVRQSWRDNKPIVWNRLNWLPRYVYFAHNVHIAAGISCNDCHGPIQSMMITYKGKAFWMSFCLNCHRQPEKFISPRHDVWKLYRDIERYGNHLEITNGQGQQISPGLTSRESALLEGKYYENQGRDLVIGEQLKRDLHIQSALLTNCSVCHH